jgi:UrcA family protein
MIRILTAMVAVTLASAASANETRIIVINGSPTAHVSYADLNLQSNSGRARMARRIRVAAEMVCDGSAIETSVIEPLRNDCYVAALASGMRQLDAITAS